MVLSPALPSFPSITTTWLLLMVKEGGFLDDLVEDEGTWWIGHIWEHEQ